MMKASTVVRSLTKQHFWNHAHQNVRSIVFSSAPSEEKLESIVNALRAEGYTVTVVPWKMYQYRRIHVSPIWGGYNGVRWHAGKPIQELTPGTTYAVVAHHYPNGFYHNNIRQNPAIFTLATYNTRHEAKAYKRKLEKTENTYFYIQAKFA